MVEGGEGRRGPAAAEPVCADPDEEMMGEDGEGQIKTQPVQRIVAS
jgi:hypothetical protein